MKKIFKYELAITDSQTVTMPTGAEILTIQNQGPRIQLWALVAEGQPPVARKIECHGTGNPIQNANGLTYIASVQTHQGQFIWHFFERA
jgi:hypothetical protein